jgi:hypothetical protein
MMTKLCSLLIPLMTLTLVACNGTNDLTAPVTGEELLVENPTLAEPPDVGVDDALPDLRSFREYVWANCYLVQEAAEAYAAWNGEYPSGPDEPGADGRSLIDFLPSGLPLINNATRVRTEPQFGRAALPGEIGYVPIQRNLVNVGYSITGFGERQVVLTLQYVWGKPTE